MTNLTDIELAAVRTALGKDTNEREVKEAIKKGVTVWDSIGEYLESLNDNGIEPEGTPEEIKAGKFAGVGLVPVTVNGNDYLVEFVL